MFSKTNWSTLRQIRAEPIPRPDTVTEDDTLFQNVRQRNYGFFNDTATTSYRSSE